MRTIYSEHSDFTFEHPFERTHSSGYDAVACDKARQSVLHPNVELRCENEPWKEAEASKPSTFEEFERLYALTFKSDWPYSMNSDSDLEDFLAWSPPALPLTFDHEKVDVENPAPKRRKRETSDKENVDALFLPAYPPDASALAAPEPASSVADAEQPRGTKRAAPEASPPPEEEDASEDDASEGIASEDDASEDDEPVLAPGLIQCHYGGCNMVIEHALWKEHMKSKAHSLPHQAREGGKLRCKWQGCSASYQWHGDVVRHLKTTHFATAMYSCARCGREFNREDSRNRHARKTCTTRG